MRNNVGQNSGADPTRPTTRLDSLCCAQAGVANPNLASMASKFRTQWGDCLMSDAARVVSVEVHKLFGKYTHKVPLSDEHVTLIYGDNGIGKTWVLRLVDALFNRRFEVFADVPFSKLVVRLSDGHRISAMPSPTGLGEPRETQSFTLRLDSGSKKVAQLSWPPASVPARELEYLLRYGHPSKRTNTADMLDRMSDVAWMRPIQSGRITSHSRLAPDMSPELGDMIEQWTLIRAVLSSTRVTFITTERLRDALQDLQQAAGKSTSEEKPDRHTISLCARDMVIRIAERLQEYALVSDQRDSTLPERFVTRDREQTYDLDDLRESLADLDQKRRRLIAAGLLPQEKSADLSAFAEINEADAGFLSIYVADVRDKLAVYDGVLERFELFSQMVNDHFETKTVIVDRSKGFTFNAGSEDDALSPTCLSSGEQHEVVLLYYLLFYASGSLVLLDEPELSLHIKWQLRFLEDSRRLASVAAFELLAATHSPQIVNNNWHLTRELAGE